MIKNVRIERVNGHFLKGSGIDLFIKREDEIHKKISGNKWRKLKYNLKQAIEEDISTIITVGGAYSNHIAAVAAAAKKHGLKSTGIIRGEEHQLMNPTLKFAAKQGMILKYTSREDFKKYKSDPTRILEQKDLDNSMFIPEGGTNQLAIKGCEEIISDISDSFQFQYYCVSIGTGGTFCGMLKGLEGNAQLLGFSSLKGEFIFELIEEMKKEYEIPFKNYQIFNQYHFGGYAKFKPELIEFINEFKKESNIPLEPIYTGKMMFGISELIKKKYFPKGSKILAIHTGGLQGIDGFNQRFGNIIL